ncbi:MAG: TatD family hydrolase [Alkalispirochaeta sp.]
MTVPATVPLLSDSHLHSTAMADRGIDPRSVLGTLREETGGIFLDVAITPEDPPRQRELTGGVAGVYYSVGLHPGSTGRDDWEAAMAAVETELGGTIHSQGGAGRNHTEGTGVGAEAVPEPRVYHAVGETGLDWYRMYAPRERQLELFYRHLELADAAGLPVIVHNRSADEDCLAGINAVAPRAGGVMHCFSSGPEWVGPFLDAGMYISFAGNVTFRNAGALRDALRNVPDDRLLLETDAPFLAPHPVRGKPNDPRLLPYTLEVAAQVRDIAPEHLARSVYNNLQRLLRLEG